MTEPPLNSPPDLTAQDRAATLPGASRIYGLATAVLLAVVAGTSVVAFLAARRTPLAFDDAYMFLRYASNVRHGLGYSWNPDGVHTYGPTSLLWALATLVLGALPTDSWTQLLIGSWLCSITALIAMAWAVAANARAAWMQSTWRVLPLVVLPLAGTAAFAGNQFIGMETMLALTLCGCFVGIALRWSRGLAHPALVGAVALLLLLARPESALVCCLLPALLFLLPGDEARPSFKSIAILYGTFLGGAALEFLACKLYFGTPVPLSVYMKGGHAYLGYSGIWHPELLLVVFLTSCQVYLAALILLARRTDRKLLIACLIPALALFAYLQTVTQIMGFNGRYYVPYLPLIVVPALLLLDRRLSDDARRPTSAMRLRAAAVACMLIFFLAISSEGVKSRVRHLENHARDEYDSAKLTIAATQPLPSKDWQPMMQAITDDLVAPLPSGVTVAATEVGYLGERSPQVSIIDIAGLNDTAIALHGFSMDDLMRRKPDILWMPHNDYTWQRGVMFSHPALLQQYDVYAGAANYGLAIRKDSPYRAAIDRQLAVFWHKTYPGFRMDDYRVTAATWSRQKHTVYGE